MIPSQSSSSPSFLFNFAIEVNNIPTPITDIETDNKAVNENLCESFEGLFKKEDAEESTRSSQWSEKEKQLASACFMEKDSQNQIKQNVISKKSFNLNQSENQNPESESIQLENIESIKKSLIEKRNKLTKYRQKFLSQPCYTKLPEELLKMIQIAQKIDHYLVQKKSAQYMDNVYNIFKTLFFSEQMSTIWSTIKKLLFIASDYYKIRIDPLKNLCLSLGCKNDIKLQVRKQSLRKLVGQYFFNHKKSFKEVGIPQAFIDPVKTSRFYPQNLSICPNIQEKKMMTKRYLSKLEQNTKKKQQKIEEIQEKCSSFAPATPQFDSNEAMPHPNELQAFCDSLMMVYANKKVHHMYKSSLIQSLRKSTTFSLQKIFFFIKFITEKQIFLEVIMKSGCKIYGLVENQKQKLINILKTRRGQTIL